MWIVFFILLTMGASVAVSAAEKAEFSPMREVAVEGFEHPEFNESMPAIDLLLDHKSRLWILGTSSLWMFELLNKQLVRIKIENLHHPLQTMSANQVNLFATNGRTLYAISLDDPSQVRRYDTQLPASLANRCMSADGTSIIWDHQTGQRMFDIGLQKFVDRHFSSGEGCGVLSFSHYWRLSSATNLSATPLSDGAPTSISLPYPATNLSNTSDSIIAWSESSVFRVAPNGKILSTIHSSKGKNLALADFVDPIQAYFFNDGAIEIFDSTKKTMRYYDLSQFSRPEKVRVFRARKYVAAVATDKKVQVFQLLDADK